MKILFIHNAYGAFSGEESFVRGLGSLLESHGHKVLPFFRSSAEIHQMPFGRPRAFFGGVYNPFIERRLRQYIDKNQSEITHIQNLFPLISPSALIACRQAGIPVLMTVQNYRLICPNGLFLSHGEVCERCSQGREYWCVLRNCEGFLSKSIGYALRNWVARKCRFFLNYVSVFVVSTEFQRRKLIKEEYPEERIVVIPNFSMAETDELSQNGSYVGFAGRVSPEKGLPVLLDAARRLPDIPFRAAGGYERMPELLKQAPENFRFTGHLFKEALHDFYADCRMIILPSIWFEGLPLVLVESMFRGIPVICSRIGGLPEIVEDGVTGLLFEPGNSEQLADKIRYLWDRPDLCREMGEAGREKALREYSPDRYYARLMSAYDKAKMFKL